MASSTSSSSVGVRTGGPTRLAGRRSALIVVDVQNDFCDATAGSCVVAGSSDILPIIKRLRKSVQWDMVVLTQDWHPAGHCSFLSTHLAAGTDTRMFQTVQLPNGVPQTMFPDHCVQDSKGAEFHTDLLQTEEDVIIRKGSELDSDSLSCFQDDACENKTDLAAKLRRARITDVYICGLALDYGVGRSALDAVSEGFKTAVVLDATKGLHGPATKAMQLTLEKAGVTLLTSSVLTNRGDDMAVQAAQYMEQHKIPLVFEKLCSGLVFYKPEDPKAYIIKELQKLQKKKREPLPRLTLLTDKDLETIFNMLDPIASGQLQAKQVVKALKGLGLGPGPSHSDLTPAANVNVNMFKEIMNGSVNL